MKYRREVVQRVILNQEKTGAIDLNFCAAVTDLGERGAALSGEQKQRIAIAQDIALFVEQGAVSNLPYRRQQQEAGNSQIEVETQQAEVTSSRL